MPTVAQGGRTQPYVDARKGLQLGGWVEEWDTAVQLHSCTAVLGAKSCEGQTATGSGGGHASVCHHRRSLRHTLVARLFAGWTAAGFRIPRAPARLQFEYAAGIYARKGLQPRGSELDIVLDVSSESADMPRQVAWVKAWGATGLRGPWPTGSRGRGGRRPFWESVLQRKGRHPNRCLPCMVGVLDYRSLMMAGWPRGRGKTMEDS